MRAIKELQGMVLMDKDILVSPVQKLRNNHLLQVIERPIMRKNQEIWLGNLAAGVTKEILREMVDDVVGAGLCTRISLPTNFETGLPKGFCYMSFSDEASTAKAITEFNSIQLLGKELRAFENKHVSTQKDLRKDPRKTSTDKYVDNEHNLNTNREDNDSRQTENGYNDSDNENNMGNENNDVNFT